MPTFLGTKRKIQTKTAVALVAGAVVLAAAIAGGVGLKNSGRSGFFATQAYIPPAGTYLDVRFASKGYGKASPGDTSVDMGVWKMKAMRGDVTVSDFNISMLVQDVVSGSPYAMGVDGSVEADDHLTNCLMRDISNNTIFSGPISPPSANGMDSTRMLFSDDFTLAMGQAINLRVECDFTTVPPNGNSDRFAGNITNTTYVNAIEPMPSLAPVPVVLSGTNGNPPKYYVDLR